MNKNLSLLVAIGAFAAISQVHSAEISVESFPVTGTSAYYYVTGTLTNAKSQIPSGGENAWGYYDCRFVFSSATWSHASDSCCDESNAQGKEWRVPNDSIRITVQSSYQTVKVPEWINRDSCSSADSEWARWAGDVAAHEWRHDADYKSYIGDSANYGGQVNDWEPLVECSQISENDAKNQLDQEMSDLQDVLGADMLAGLDALANEFHGESGRPNVFPEIDLSNECP